MVRHELNLVIVSNFERISFSFAQIMDGCITWAHSIDLLDTSKPCNNLLMHVVQNPLITHILAYLSSHQIILVEVFLSTKNTSLEGLGKNVLETFSH